VGALGDRGGPDGDLALRRSMADVMTTAATDADAAALLDVTQRLCWLRRNTPALRDASAPTRVLCNTNQQMAYARVAPDGSQVALVVRTYARAPPASPVSHVRPDTHIVVRYVSAHHWALRAAVRAEVEG